jgi:hypothetical protein
VCSSLPPPPIGVLHRCFQHTLTPKSSTLAARPGKKRRARPHSKHPHILNPPPSTLNPKSHVLTLVAQLASRQILIHPVSLALTRALSSLFVGGGSEGQEDLVLMVHDALLSAFSLSSGEVQGTVQLPSGAVGRCQHSVHLVWAPLCGLAFIALASLAAGKVVAKGGLDTVAVAVVHVGEGQARAAGGERNLQVAGVVAARDAAVMLVRVRCGSGDGAGDGAGGEAVAGGVGEEGGVAPGSECGWRPAGIFLGGDGRSLRWLQLEGSRHRISSGRDRASVGVAEGPDKVEGGTERGDSPGELWNVSMEALLGLSGMLNAAAGSTESVSHLMLPEEVVLSRIWPRALPARLPSAAPSSRSSDGRLEGGEEDLADVAAWDVKGHRVVSLCISSVTRGTSGGHTQGASAHRLIGCDTVLLLDEDERVVQVAWRGRWHPEEGEADHLAVLTTERVVVVERCRPVRGSPDDRRIPPWSTVGLVVERSMESVMWIGGTLCFSSPSCIRTLYAVARGNGAQVHARCPQRATEVDTICTLDTRGGVLAACLADRLIYVAQENGSPFVVSRPVGLLAIAMRGDGWDPALSSNKHLEGSRRARAAEVCARYDGQRAAPALLAELCQHGEGPLAWALASRLEWLPLHHMLPLAFRCAEYRYCLSALDSMARVGVSDLRYANRL